MSGEKANSFDPDKAIADSRRKPLSRKEMEGFGSPEPKAPDIMPMLTLEKVKTEGGVKIVPVVGVKGKF